jgi:hypothetical protein
MTFPSLLVRTLRLALPLYLATVLLALLPTTVMMLGLQTLAGDRPWRGDLLGPGWLNLVTEIVMEAYYGHGLPGLLPIVVGGVLLVPLAMLAQLLVSGFLAGGILEQLRPTLESGRGFWAACRRWFWPFFRVSMLGGVVMLLSVLGAGLLSVVLRRFASPDLAAVIQYVVQAVVLGWMELARAVMVRRGGRAAGRALARAGLTAVRPRVLVVWLLVALPSSALTLAALMPPAVSDPYTGDSLLLALAYGQVVAFVGAWCRVIRLVVATRLAQSAGGSERATADRLSPGPLSGSTG